MGVHDEGRRRCADLADPAAMEPIGGTDRHSRFPRQDVKGYRGESGCDAASGECERKAGCGRSASDLGILTRDQGSGA